MEGIEFGPYRVIGELAIGGMAVVYEAMHELLGRPAAIKVLHPHMSAQHDLVRRFFQEAQAAARIEHPGIVVVLDVGYTPTGQAYIVMERLVGETLRSRLKRAGPLPIDTTLTLIRQLASAIGAAHEAGIVHRDLSPGNLFLVHDPEVPGGERIKVLDFGLAKLTAFAGTRLTGDGMLMGTPGYMAPEQCVDAAKVDERADLYAIGCLLYHCLCGRPPFKLGELDALKPHPDKKPVRPRVLRPEVPEFVDALAMQLLETSPDRRTPSCAALMAELEAGGERAPGKPQIRNAQSTSCQEELPFPETALVESPIHDDGAITDIPGNSVPKHTVGSARTEITTPLRVRSCTDSDVTRVGMAARESFPAPEAVIAAIDDAADEAPTNRHILRRMPSEPSESAIMTLPLQATPLALDLDSKSSVMRRLRRRVWQHRLWWGAAGLVLLAGLAVMAF